MLVFQLHVSSVIGDSAEGGMSSERYTPGSVAKLLGSKSPVSGHETKLQAIFSKPAAQSRTQSVSTCRTL